MATSEDTAQPTFTRDVEALSQTEFDVVIIGGGISGAWLALHCARSGLSTALIEKGDYASQTSSSSSKLLHGGIRYLQQLQFFKVRESAIERAHYIYAAPQLSTAVPFAVPTYKDIARSKLLLQCGMLVYKILCWGQNRLIGNKEELIPPTRSISASALNKICDLKSEPHTGAVVFHERHMLNSERMVLAILKTAQQHGAKIVNYVTAQQYLREDNRISGVQAHDQRSDRSFAVNARLVVNAAGPWIDELNGTLAASRKPTINGFAVGSHIITRQLSDHAIALTTKQQGDTKIDRGGRHVFVIPWRGYSLIGTSYSETANPDTDMIINAEHIAQLLDAVNHSLPGAKLIADDVLAAYSGLYPLRVEKIRSGVYQGTGEYEIIDHANADNVEGLVTALGAKFTTGRKLSALTMRVIAKKLDRPAQLEKCRLHNSQFESTTTFRTQMQQRYGQQLDTTTIDHLVSHYGSELDALMQRIADHPDWLQPISAGGPDILGQVVWAVEQEQAVTLQDILLRRTSAGQFPLAQSELLVASDLAAQLLGWSDARKEAELTAYEQRAAATRAAVAAV